MSQLVSFWNNVWRKTAEIPYWWHVTTEEVKYNKINIAPTLACEHRFISGGLFSPPEK